MQTFLKHTLKAAVFMGGLVLLLFLLSKVFIPADGTIDDGVNTVNANSIYKEREQSVEVIFLGDSEIYAAVSPMQIWQEYGIPTYCCSTSAQKLWYSEDILRKAFKNQSPKIVLMETNALFRKFNFDDSLMHKVENVLPVFQYHNRWKVFADEALGVREENNSTTAYKGYYPSYKIKPAMYLSRYNEKSDQLTEIPNRNRSYLKSIKKYCEDNGAQLILFSTPSTVNWYYAKHNAITKLAKEIGIEYLDMNIPRDEIGIDWSMDSRDTGDHLNHFGAIKATAYIGKYLSGKDGLNDHRGEAEYSDWDKELEVYLAKTEKGMKKALKKYNAAAGK